MKNIEKKWTLFLLSTFVCIFGIVDTLIKGTEATELVLDDISVSNIKFDSSIIVEEDKKYILYLETGILVNTFIDKIGLSEYDVSVYDKENKEKDNFSVITTGDVLIISLNGKKIDQYLLSVKGDSNGDGVIDLTDLLQMKKYIVDWKHPVTNKGLSKSDVYYYALDLNIDGVVDILDLTKMNDVMMGMNLNEKN